MKKLAAFLMFVPFMAHASFKTGNELYMDMISNESVSKGIAIGYVMGVTDTGRDVWFCPPKDGGGITAGQMHDMVKNYLQANPQNRNMSADVIVLVVMGQNWPCKNKQQNGRGA